MKLWLAPAAVAGLAMFLLLPAQNTSAVDEQLARHRNLGKAFYENPTTQKEAVEEFRKALALQPESARERLNYGLALLRAGQADEGVAELKKVQEQDPSLPHTWFNLGIAYKRAGEHEQALKQFERMLTMVPDDPISWYNAGVLRKLLGDTAGAMTAFEKAAALDPGFAAPRFQLFNAYRVAGKAEEAKKQLAAFQQLKKEQEGAAIPEDVEWNMYAEVFDIMEDTAPRVDPVEPTFASRPLGRAEGIVLADANADGRPDVLRWTAAGLLGLDGKVVAGTEGIQMAAAGDFDNDGRQDLVAILKGRPVLLHNTTAGFAVAPLPAAGTDFSSALWVDFDHDYDLDLLLLGTKSTLLRNEGSAGFADRSGSFPFRQGEAVAAAVTRIIPDTKGFDIVVSYRDGGGTLYRDALGGRYTAEDFPLPDGAADLQVHDINNDGWLDLAYVSGEGAGALRNRKGKFEADLAAPGAKSYAWADLTNRGLLDLMTPGSVRRNSGRGTLSPAAELKVSDGCVALAAADVNADGKIDLACAAGEGARLLENTSKHANQFLRVGIGGIKNLKLASSAEIEVKAGPRYQKALYPGWPVTFGLGQEQAADTVRITWPNGLIQNEIKQSVGKPYQYAEAQRLSGSCPIIWSWNGKQFEYITDVLGVAPLGASAGDGTYFPVDHDEYVQIAGSSLQPREGEYEIRITEELSEVAYLDQVRLLAVDHPAAVSIYTNDKFKAPPFPDFRLFGVDRPIRPIAARDSRGQNVRAALLNKDLVYPDGFRRDMAGVAEKHTLELDFGRNSTPADRSILVLHGWVDWADGSTFLGAAQQGGPGLMPPYLQVKNESGQWKTVIEDMGMPAGKPKTIVVDLSGKWLSESREVRIVTNLCVYWDEIFLADPARQFRPAITEAPLLTAGLRFRGFSPNRVHPQRKQPEQFWYDGELPESMWNPTPGLYTRYGPVLELAEKVDEKLIIMGSGDELRLRFSARDLPPVPPGFRRDFLLMVDGWAKDRDPNTAFGQTVEPLPFHGMSSYPPPIGQKYPDTPELREYRQRYNTRPALRPLRPIRPSD
jgi:tetratricopeptide (TPR) repeat protein